jgi:hypothetical protein
MFDRPAIHTIKFTDGYGLLGATVIGTNFHAKNFIKLRAIVSKQDLQCSLQNQLMDEIYVQRGMFMC